MGSSCLDSPGIARSLLLPLVLFLASFGSGWRLAIAQPNLGSQSAPTPSYFASFRPFWEGDYEAALKQFRREGRGAIKTVESHWIDSICYHTMVGECHYQMGQLAPALEQYEAALRLYLAFPDWMIRVQFPATIRTASAGAYQPIPWGQSRRGAKLGDFPSNLKIAQGQFLTEQTLRQGGRVQQPVLFPIVVDEIVRCTCLAMRRRGELLGPIAAHEPLTKELELAFTRRPGPPNHWSETWIDAQLAVAYLAAGKIEQARPVLERAVLAAGQFDHPLTSTMLLELGRLAMQRGDYQAAADYFVETTYAAYRYPDVGVIEEAFRLALVTQLVSGAPGFYAPLERAARWARTKNFRQLQTVLISLAAENAVVLGDTSRAIALVDEARSVMGRRDMAVGRAGAELNHVASAALYQQGNVEAGDQAIAAAVNYARNGSRWLFQIALADERYVAELLSPRQSMSLYEELLRDPTAADWSFDPLGALAISTGGHAASHGNWFETALARKEPQTALAIADLARRERFVSHLFSGSRLLSLRWVLAGPPEALSTPARLSRERILNRFPQLAALLKQSQEIRAELAARPLVTDEPNASRQQTEQIAELRRVSQAAEAILREIAVRREPCELVFPPVRSADDLQNALSETQALLAFYCTAKQVHAFLVSRKNLTTWQVGTPAVLHQQVVKLLKALGQVDGNRALSLAQLADEEWKTPAGELWRLLTDGAKTDLLKEVDEVVIVPDEPLWYVPWGALVPPAPHGRPPLMARVQLRIAPTAGLAVADPRGRPQAANTAIVVGRLFPRDEALTESAVAELEKVVAGAVVLTGALPAPSAVCSTLVDRLIVLDDVVVQREAPLAWAPMMFDRGSPGNSLGDWTALPWGGPGQVIAPGFHSAAENALKGVRAEEAGEELFLTACTLMATGTRGALLSLWRSGGQTSIDLVREYLQEMPHSSAAEAWQRSVLLVADSDVDLDREPRVDAPANAEPIKATHPFFWGGYLLIEPGMPRADDEPAAEAPPAPGP